MNKENFEKIIADLDNLKNLIEFFTTQEEIPAIEIDIAKRKLQDIYVLFSESINGKKKFVKEKEVELPSEEPPKKIDVIEEKPPIFEIEREPKEIVPEPKIVEEKESIKEEIIEKPQKTESPKPKPTSSSGTLSDKLGTNNISLNERLSNKSGNDLSSRLQKGPIKDLNTAIGLNDKFSYIKALFNGDAHKFREAVERLNEAQTTMDAENFISANFDWDVEDPVTQQFLELVKRKLQYNG